MPTAARSRALTCAALVILALLASPVRGAAGARARLVAQGFQGVTAIAVDPMFPDTLLVAQTDGLVLRVRNGQTQRMPFLDLRGIVTPPGGEQGLLGLAFPLDAESSGRVFVNFTNASGATVVARFTRRAEDPRAASLASRKDLLWPIPGGGGRQGFISRPSSSHNGGHLAFGPDSYLYIGLGDGSAGNDPSGNAQSGIL